MRRQTWVRYDSFELTRKKPYAHYEFPRAFSAHWARIRVDRDCTATAYFVYD